MRLSDFILTHREKILSEWVTFARSCMPTSNAMDLATLRDHASEMLSVIAADLDTAQSKLEQADKSKGKSDADPDPLTFDTAAQSHGSSRAASGFSIEQMVSEYRALRASVTRLWIETAGQLTRTDIDDLVRFNEAIDQALAESTLRFTVNLEQSKEMFLAMLGHDLKTPLGAIIASAHVIVNIEELPEAALKMACLVLSSGERMSALIGDLLDFARTRLGSGIPIDRVEMNIENVCKQVIVEITAMHPRRVVNFEATGKLQGQWDNARISQALSNVISNAVEHGTESTPIHVTVRGEADQVVLAVQNWGPIIPANELDQIFAPMHRIDNEEPFAPRSNLGLGLYIAESIIAAHEGTIRAASSEEKGTTFTIHLPTATGSLQ
jgi:signal transduction histidine kinase